MDRRGPIKCPLFVGAAFMLCSVMAWSADKLNDVLTVGIGETHGEFPYYFVKNGKPEGIMVDFFAVLSDQGPLKFRVESYPRNRLDVLFDRGMVEIRLAHPDWVRTDAALVSTEPLFFKTDRFYRSDGGADIDDMTDLYGQSVCTVAGFRYSDTLEALFAQDRIDRQDAESVQSQVRMLTLNRCQALISNPGSLSQLDERLRSRLQPTAVIDAEWAVSIVLKEENGVAFDSVRRLLNDPDIMARYRAIEAHWLQSLPNH